MQDMPMFLQEGVRDTINKIKQCKTPIINRNTMKLLDGRKDIVVITLSIVTLVTKIPQEEDTPEEKIDNRPHVGLREKKRSTRLRNLQRHYT